jgi:DNA polymerase III epsilon subunit-like protein
LTIIVFDFETGSLETGEKCQPLQLAMMAINPQQQFKVMGKYSTYIRPSVPYSELSKKALEVNRISEETLNNAPALDSVWPSIESFIKKFNTGKRGYGNSMPVAAGYNIRNFDLPIFDTLCCKFGCADKDGRNKLFNKKLVLDIIDIIQIWTLGSNVIDNHKFDTVRQWLGLSMEGAHNAEIDVSQEASVLVRFLETHKYYFNTTPFADTFKRKPETRYVW